MPIKREADDRVGFRSKKNAISPTDSNPNQESLALRLRRITIVPGLTRALFFHWCFSFMHVDDQKEEQQVLFEQECDFS